jgi:hypothetical protein
MPWRTRATSRKALLCLVPAVLLTGCAGLRPYSENRHQQATAAQTAWKAVDLPALVATERGNLDRLLAAELATQSKLATSIRDHRLRYMLGAEPLGDTLLAPIQTDLKRLVGDPAAFAQSRTALQQHRVQAEQRLAVLKDEFSAKRLPMPRCAEVAGTALPATLRQWRQSASALDAAEIDAATKQLRKVCATSDGTDDTLITQVYQPLGGQMAEALQRYQADAQALAQRRQQAAEAQARYAQAQAAYQAAVQAGQVDPKAVPAVADAAQQLHKAVDALEGSRNPWADQFLSQERLHRLDGLLQVVTDGLQSDADATAPDPAANRTATALVILPELVDQAREAAASHRRPLAVPLLIRRDIEALKLQAAQRDIATQQAELRLSRELLDALYQQAHQLWLAERELLQDGTGPGAPPDLRKLHAMPLADALADSKTTPTQREALYSAAGRYLDSIKRLEARRHQLELRRIAQAHERGLAYAEINALQWKPLIDVSVNQVADASAGGIQAGHVAALLNTVGLLWIGHGVN